MSTKLIVWQNMSLYQNNRTQNNFEITKAKVGKTCLFNAVTRHFDRTFTTARYIKFDTPNISEIILSNRRIADLQLEIHGFRMRRRRS